MHSVLGFVENFGVSASEDFVGDFHLFDAELVENLFADFRIEIVETRKAVKENNVRISGSLYHLHVYLVSLELFDPLLEKCLFAHRYPNVGVDDVSVFYSFHRIFGELDDRTCFFSDFLHLFYEIFIGPECFRSAGYEVHSHFCSADHKAVAHVVPCIAAVNKFYFVEGFRNVFFDREEVSKDLGRVVKVGKTVPNRNTCIFCKCFNSFLLESAEFDAVEHPAKNFRGVFDGLFFAHLTVVRAEESYASAFVHCAYFECAAGSRRGFFEKKDDVLSFKQIAFDSRSFLSLEVVSKVEKIADIFRGKVFECQKVSSFKINSHFFLQKNMVKQKTANYRKAEQKSNLARQNKIDNILLLWYIRTDFGGMMKKTLFIFLFFLSFFSLSAETLHLSAFNNKDFVSDVNNALISESPEILVKAASPYLSKMHELNIPNCFGCSLYLIKMTENADPEMQLAAADLAVKFSDDLPEVHHHYLVRLFHFAPSRPDKTVTHFFKAVDRSLRFAFANSVTYLFIGKLSVICLIFFIIFIAVMFLKYTGLVIHKYKHIVGFSKFYGIGFLITFFVSMWLVAENFNNVVFLIIPFLIFFSDLGTRAEKAVLHAAVLFFILTSALSMTAEKHKPSQYDQDTAYNHLLAVISPDLLPEENIDLSQPGAYMAKGFIFLYNGNFSRAAFNLKKELSSVKIPEIKTMLSNALGIALASNGNHREAVPYLREAYESSGNPKIGYNLSKILDETGFKEEAAKLEKKLIYSASSESFSYPSLYFPDTSKIWHYLCYENDASTNRNIINSAVHIVMAIIFYLFIILLKYCYSGSFKLSRCLECGNIMCSKCNAGGNDVCAVCKLMKADYTLFKRGERENYEARRDNFFRRRSIIMNILTFTIPGGGLLFINKILEGSVYLAVPLTITLVYFMNTMGLVVDKADGSLMKIIIILTDLFIYCISVIRALFSVRRD